jgi:hypothetical protein
MPEDVAFLANLTQHSDVNVNTASTMTLDFSIHDRPVVNLAFDAKQPPPGRMSMSEFYGWEHYKPIVDLRAARVAWSAEELAGHVNFCLEHPEADRKGRQGLVKLEVGQPIGHSGRLIADALGRLQLPRA